MLDLLPHETVGLVVEELEPDEAARISLAMPDARLPLVLDETGPEVAADVLRALPRDAAMRALDGMKESAEVAPLLGYEDDDAGGLMTPDFIALYDDMSINQATAFVRRLGRDLDPKDISYLFAVDRDGVLKGGIRPGRDGAGAAAPADLAADAARHLLRRHGDGPGAVRPSSWSGTTSRACR